MQGEGKFGYICNALFLLILFSTMSKTSEDFEIVRALIL